MKDYQKVGAGDSVDASQATADYVRSIAKPSDFAELRIMRIQCGPTQHDYQQGNSSMDVNDPLNALLYCRNCGDVIAFALPREESDE